jgi:uncharacterized repeat protein (TIGR01451 family)
LSASSSPRPLVGLAAAVLVFGLAGAPVLAYADQTPRPTPTPVSKPVVTAPATPSPTGSPEADSASSAPADPKTDAPSESAPPSGSSSPSPSESATSPDEASPDPEQTVAARVNGDAIAEPGPTVSGSPAPETATQAVAGASIALTKSASPTRVSRVGQVVTYTFRATNNGSVPLSDVGITDELEGLSGSTCPTSGPTTGATLAAGQALTCSAKLTVTQAILDFGDIYNFASVFGTVVIIESPDDYVGANAAARVTVDQAPSIALKASVSPSGKADRGDRLRYRATATNTGNVTLTRARITSSLGALNLDCEPSAGATLAPGASIGCAGSYRVSTADARRGRVTNELTARAERPFGDTGSTGDDVTDEVRLRVAVTKVPVTKVADDTDPGLADTGGPALPIGLAGVAAVGLGLALVRRSRRG